MFGVHFFSFYPLFTVGMVVESFTYASSHINGKWQHHSLTDFDAV